MSYRCAARALAKTRIRAWRLAWLIALLSAAIAEAAAQDAVRGGRLRGVVVDADTGAPIAAASVTLNPPPSTRAPRTVLTDAMGRYEFAPVTEGTYVVAASKPTYVTSFFGRQHTIDEGGTIDMARDQDRDLVDFQLNREAVLAGRVTNASGQGLADLVIKVSRPHLVGGQRQLVSFGSARSDAAGDYRVTGLPPGSYYMSVSLFENSDSRAAKYAPTFYPASAEVATAIRIRLNAGATVRIDPVTPLPLPWRRLTGRLKSSDGKQLMRGALILQPRDPDGLSLSPDAVMQMFPDGRFSFDFILPGHYIVRAQGNTGTDRPDLFASWPVNVEGDLVEDHTMTLKPGSDLSGVVRFDSDDTPPPADLIQVRVHAPLVDGSGFSAESTTQLNRDGSFKLISVDAGRRLIRVDGLPAPWSLESVLQEHLDIIDEPMAIVQQQKLRDVELVFTDVVTGLTGQVLNRQGRPIVNALVVAFSVNQAYWRPLSRHIQTARTHWDGRYRLASLPPGEYRVAAAGDFEEDDIYSRESLDQISLKSVPALLVSGTMRVQDFVATMGSGSGGR
jgi:protocatechuate 3,4-dioxygenase beta subunit